MLWRAQALRILNAGKSRYYDAALDNLERARDCFRRAGREAEWEKTVMELSRAHARTQGFSRGLAAVAPGESRVRPSFLETAMAKWNKRGGQ